MECLIFRTLGKQIVYHAIQDPTNCTSMQELAAMDSDIADLRERIALTKANERSLKARFVALNATLSTDEVRSSVMALEREKEELAGRLEELRSGNMKPVLPDEKEAVEKGWAEWAKKASSRKRICLDMWAIAIDGLPEGQTKEEFWVKIRSFLQLCNTDLRSLG